ncbi:MULTISPECIES: CoA-transferase subunit beta [unclassified Nocardioides]|uniref:CoA-transferase subunit beta n=1 Tax=unclassified Nocardioides TaxID=2615069 RepID=UPI00114D6DF6|nr:MULTISPECIES: CoA-transferase [unclassified Nocardioides]TQK69011.1 acyl CoA:acetate/3-ketoacid CoA transferase beta subunit [Nocardioides sp. SLBN-35]WGY01756.1 CoA-transferase [Nocardioides sp. QY071]
MSATTDVTTEVTRAEVCVVACADAWRGSGEILAHAVGIVPTISARLAKLTSEPDLVLTDGDCFLMSEPPPLGRNASAGGTIESWAPFRRVFEILATGRRHSMMGASQVDRYGNQNISSIGDWRKPTRQLIGVRGAPGNTVNHRTDYWVSKHSARVFVEAVDVVSGVGNDRARAHEGRALRFHDLGVVVTDLAVLDYDDDGRLKVRSLHPGVTAEEVAENTGFAIDTSTAGTTRLPTAEELELIRTVLDPKGLRDKEVRR